MCLLRVVFLYFVFWGFVEVGWWFFEDCFFSLLSFCLLDDVYCFLMCFLLFFWMVCKGLLMVFRGVFFNVLFISWCLLFFSMAFSCLLKICNGLLKVVRGLFFFYCFVYLMMLIVLSWFSIVFWRFVIVFLRVVWGLFLLFCVLNDVYSCLIGFGIFLKVCKGVSMFFLMVGFVLFCLFTDVYCFFQLFFSVSFDGL